MAKDDTYKRATARALVKMREAHGLNKSQVARAAGTSYLNVHRWESAEGSTPTIANLAALADAYDTSLPDVVQAIEQAKRAMRGGE